MDSSPRESRLFVFELCSIWGCVIGSWAVLQVATPLVLKDIVGKTEAPTWQGIFTATTAVSGVVLCGLTGHFSDRMGRLQFLTPWMVFFFVTTVLVVLSDIHGSIYMLWVARVAAISVPSTILHAFFSDYMKGNALLESFGYLGATFSTSMITSSFLCGVISWYYSRVAALTFGSCLACIGMLLTFAVKVPIRPLDASSTAEVKTETTPLFASASSLACSMSTIYKDTLLRNLICSLALLRVGNVTTQMMLVLFVDFRLGWGLPEMSIMVSVSAMFSVLCQIVGVRFVISSDIVLPVLFIVLAMIPLLTASYAMAVTGPQMYLVSILGSMASIAPTIFSAKITAIASEDGVAGLVLGCVGTLQNVLEVFVALTMGKLLSWSLENQPRTSILSGLPFIVNGVFLSVVVVIVLYTHKRYGSGRTSWVEAAHP
ncbi:putative transporter [Trypanosoma rangeli]|uniref:Putative transporter n=1 Tax=Trypanosoma rangeli TaxID=5698 RepID=A0A422P2W1_TRYRA|nr:putative transporter [Trypanosoma rangeli]RNF12004.1 putative transporter [Trypanosoma rangeli]|eukprot:RNF12004.1 putative transporter [Trypanosoma rangeli]